MRQNWVRQKMDLRPHTTRRRQLTCVVHTFCSSHEVILRFSACFNGSRRCLGLFLHRLCGAEAISEIFVHLTFVDAVHQLLLRLTILILLILFFFFVCFSTAHTHVL